jgi:hypothetical protein
MEIKDFTVILSVSSAYVSVSLLDEYKVWKGINGKTSSQRNILIKEGKCQCLIKLKKKVNQKEALPLGAWLKINVDNHNVCV